ncbi:hypothetical protein BDZ91DRAFT_744201 [Kalaharituber pfeilii]|nr:hypothetical protein BDZ91DRAFT_744201 [Kalaharituber pfeilii]
MSLRIRNARAAIRANQPDRDGLSSLSESAISNVSPSGLARRLGLTCRLRKRMISMRA